MRTPHRLTVSFAAVVAGLCLLGQLAAIRPVQAEDASPAATAAATGTRHRASLSSDRGLVPGAEVPTPSPTARASNLIMSEGFEGPWPTVSWEAFDDDGSSHGEYFWDEDDFKPHTGSFSAWPANGGANGVDPSSHDYAGYMDTWMVYGPFDLSGCSHPYFEFYWWNQSQTEADYFFWGASGDGIGFDGWQVSGDSGGWVHEAFDLSDWAGDSSVWIAFLFQSDGTQVDAGPFVDDIRLWAEVVVVPGAFAKLAPAAGATAQPQDVTLRWKSAFLAASYEYCYDTTDDGACSDWRSTGPATRANLSCLAANTTFYWQVRAVNPAGVKYANGSLAAFRAFSTGPSAGRPCGSDFRVSGPGATAYDYSPAAAWNGTAGEYLVVWEDGRSSDTRGRDIYGRRVAADGTGIGGDFRISGPRATSNDMWPAVAWNGTAGEYLVVWRDGRHESTRSAEVYGRRLSATGAPIGGDFRISGSRATLSATYMDAKPQVVWNGTDDEYLVVWQDTRHAGTRGLDVYGRRVSAAGSPLGNDLRISSPAATSDERYPAVAWDETADQYLVVWADGRDGSTPGLDIFGRLVKADGTGIGGDFRISGASSDYDATTPDVARNGTDNEYLVVWSVMHPDGKYDLYGRRLDAAGTAVGGDFRISGPDVTAEEYKAAVAWNEADERYLVIWSDVRQISEGTVTFAVYGRKVGAGGATIGGEFRTGDPGATLYSWSAPAMAYNTAADQFLVLWEDERDWSRGNDIWARRVTG